METSKEITLSLEQLNGFEFKVKFEGIENNLLLTDEPPPLGRSKGPNPSQLLSAAVGNCLAASLLFCMRKARIEPKKIKATVKTVLTRNEKGRIRIGGIRVSILPEFENATQAEIARCLELFEDFCTVTQSVRRGIDVQVEVTPSVTELIKEEVQVY